MKSAIRLLVIFLTILIFATTIKADITAYYTKIQKGKNWEATSLTGKYADIIVRFDSIGELIFWRGTSYLPYWKTDQGQWAINEVIKRSGDGTEEMPDRINQYSYVRIIENSPEKVIIHWRYKPRFNSNPDLTLTSPDFGDVGFTDVVHEIFTITSSGDVTRKIQPGKENRQDWLDPKNIKIEKLHLTKEGIKTISSSFEEASKPTTEAIDDTDIKSIKTTNPIVHLKFDEAVKSKINATTNFATNKSYPIDSQSPLWKKGISGSCLAFDGYGTKVAIPSKEIPECKEAITLSAWFAPGAYPVSQWTGIFHQSTWKAKTNPHFRFDNIDWGTRQLGEIMTEGFYLGIDGFGHMVFKINIAGRMHELVTEQIAPLNEWTHIAASYGNNQLTFYLNGSPLLSKTELGPIVTSNGDLTVGMNDDRISYVPRYTHRPFSAFPTRMGFEGLIDDVLVYNKALTPEEMNDYYQSSKPDNRTADLQSRKFPGMTGKANRFGAIYTKLTYHDLWDNLWRSSDYPDVVVKFDDQDASIVFWRGTCYGASYVTDNNYWVTDQSIELTDWNWNNKPKGTNSTCEHMMDHETRFSHVRIIENHPARIVIHWRYASVDANYKHPNWARTDGWGVWTDEYYTIYPDGTVIRSVDTNGSIDYYFDPPAPAHFSAPQLLFAPGTKPIEIFDEKSLTLANKDGEIAYVDYLTGEMKPKIDANIQMINHKSESKVWMAYHRPDYIIKTGWDAQPHAKEEESQEDVENKNEEHPQASAWQEVLQWSSSWKSVELEPLYGEGMMNPGLLTQSKWLNGLWNHWPVSQHRVDGRNACAFDRAMSTEFINGATGDTHKEAMYGITKDAIETLIPKVKMWDDPPAIYSTNRLKNLGFDSSQFAYCLIALGDKMTFNIDASTERPLVKPGFVIKNWIHKDHDAAIKIDNNKLIPNKDFFQSSITDTDGSITKIIWLNFQTEKRISIEVSKVQP